MTSNYGSKYKYKKPCDQQNFTMVGVEIRCNLLMETYSRSSALRKTNHHTNILAQELPAPTDELPISNVSVFSEKKKIKSKEALHEIYQPKNNFYFLKAM